MNDSLPRYKTITSLLLFLVGLGTIAYCLSHISQQYSQFKDYQLPPIKTVSLQHPPVQTVTIGSSHSEGINFNTLGKQGEYLNITGADIFEASYTAEQLTGKINSLATIYMAIAYPVLRIDNAKIRPPARIRNYYLLPRPSFPCSKLIDQDIVNCIKAWLMPITRHDHWESILTQKAEKTTHSEKQRRSDRVKLNETSIRKRAKHHIRLFQKGSELIQANTKLQLERTIQKLQHHDVTIVFFTPPYHPRYVELIQQQKPELIKITHSVMNELSQKYGVFYKDYNSAEFPLTGFRNPDHLNEIGSQVFTELLKNDVEHFRQIQ